MTISWGSLGVMWGRPFVQVVVRPQRYTFEFMERYQTFTLCAFPRQYHQALSLLGTKSGRDGDKIAEAGLTPTSAPASRRPPTQKRSWSSSAAKSTGRIMTRRTSLTRPLPEITRSKITTGFTLAKSWPYKVQTNTTLSQARLAGLCHTRNVSKQVQKEKSNMIKNWFRKAGAIRRFYQDAPIDMQTLRELVDLGRLSPSGSNLQPLKYMPLQRAGEERAHLSTPGLGRVPERMARPRRRRTTLRLHHHPG